MTSENTSMDIQEIMRYLPHRPPFLFVDRVLEINPGKSLVAIKNVSMNESFFVGHFPGRPIMPGVIMLEALAQASAVLAFKSTGESPEDGLYLFAGVEEVRFKRIVQPGDQLILKIELLKLRHTLMKVRGIAYVDGEEACSAVLTSIKKKEPRE